MVFCAVGCMPIANAVEISPKDTREGEVIVSVSGGIKEGDAEKLEASLENARSLGLQVNAIALDSPGGRISAGASMAKLVRSRQIKTIVNDSVSCTDLSILQKYNL